MNEEKLAKIAKLAGEAHDKLQRVKALRMMNISITQALKRQQAIDYAIAQAELYEANSALEKAMVTLNAPHERATEGGPLDAVVRRHTTE